jgi:DNA polymerase IV
VSARSIIHVDMDAFYASVEQRDDPALRGRPVIVGGHPKRGVVLAASYEVRPFGVRSAMPMAQAVRLAPSAIVVPPRFEAYAAASERVFEIFESMTPLIEPLSLDEAFLDVSGSIRLFGPAAEIARAIRDRIAREISLPASAGIAASKFVAKIASDVAKPNGQIEVPAEETRAFLAPLPVSRLWGVGPKGEAALAAIGLHKIGDVAREDPGKLEQRLGDHGRHLWALANGIDDREVMPDREAKSIGSEDTFAEDLSGKDVLAPHIHSQAWRVARRLRRAKLTARIVVLKVKLSDFRLLTRRVTLDEPTDDAQRIFGAALDLFDRAAPRSRVRLTGVSVQGLDGGPEQLSLLGEGARSKRLGKTIDEIAARFGTEAVLPADMLEVDSGEDQSDARRLAGGSRLDLGPKRR